MGKGNQDDDIMIVGNSLKSAFLEQPFFHRLIQQKKHPYVYSRKLKPLQWKSQDVVKFLPMDTALSLMVTIVIFEDFEIR